MHDHSRAWESVDRSIRSRSRLYRYYVLGALTLVSTFNFLDRIVIVIVQEPLKHEFGLTDFQLGLLGGPAFAILYVVMGFPFARWAERGDRARIVAAVLAVWSAMTAVCGVVANFAQMFVARMGVSVGEAGGAPPSQSMIADLFEREERGTAFSIYGLGAPLGGLLAAAGGGISAQHLGWRATFVALGTAGIVLAVVFMLTVRDAGRSTVRAEVPPLRSTMAFLWKRKTFRHVAAGNAVAVFSVYSMMQYIVSFFVRRYHLELVEASMILGLVSGVAGGLGIMMGGYFADRLTPRFPRSLAHVPMAGLLLAFPFFLAAFLTGSMVASVGFLVAGSFLQYFYLGPSYAIAQSVAEPRMRATTTAVLLCTVNLFGLGLGPPLLGALSDHLTALGIGNPAAGAGLPIALTVFSVGLLWAAFHYYRVSRTLLDDLTT